MNDSPWENIHDFISKFPKYSGEFGRISGGRMEKSVGQQAYEKRLHEISTSPGYRDWEEVAHLECTDNWEGLDTQSKAYWEYVGPLVLQAGRYIRFREGSGQEDPLKSETYEDWIQEIIRSHRSQWRNPQDSKPTKHGFKR